MSPRKLSDSNRQEILELYRQTEETTSSLASRFGVSSSTISRFLKSSMSKREYENLIQAKRLARTPGHDEQEEKTAKTKKSKKSSKKPKTTAKAKTKTKAEAKAKAEKIQQLQLEIDNKTGSFPEVSTELAKDSYDVVNREIMADVDVVEETLPEEADTTTVAIEDLNLDLEEEEEEGLEVVQEVAAMFGEDMDDEDMDDEDDEDDEEDEGDDELIEPIPLPETQLQVLSLNDAHFPRVCYLVIDRYSELVTKPMKDFAHLGSIPDGETQQKTLPIFDNHKVAKRFCARKGKVIKVPDGRLLQKTSDYLQAKGISRILMDGKIYSLV